MRSLRKRITSLLLILVTLLTMVPTTAFAAVPTGTGITPTTDESWWAIRLTSTGQSYTYRPPLVAGKYLYCMDFGYSYRYGTPEFLNSYTYTAATGASADDLWDDAITQTGLGEMDAMTKENVKWMMSYIVTYKGEVPGALFMALQTYIWDHQSDKSAGADTSGDIDAGGYANADTYEIYLGYCDWLLEQKATEDAALQRKVEEYAAQGIQASIVEDDSTKWAILATSSVKGRQSFFAYYSQRKVVADDEPQDEDNSPPPVAGDADLTFQKLSATTGKGLNGAVYNIYFNGTIIGTEVTAGGGYIELTGISTGLYSFVEQSAPKGYALDPTPHSVYVDVTDGDKQYTVTATDEKHPDMEIVKLDAQTGEEIEGAVFSVRSATGSYSTTVTTDRYGETSLEELPVGVYVVKEVSVLEPYVASDTEQTVALVPGKTTTVTFTNYRSPGLEILKKHIATGDPIAHVTYKIEQLDGEYSTSATTDSEGRIYLDSIPVGTYRITETNVPANVILCSESQTVTLKAGQTSTVTFHNAMKPSLLIRKVDSVTGDTIQGVKFSIQYASDNTTTGETNDLGIFYTDENGEIILTDVKRGWYKVTEVEPAKGYAIRGEASQEFYLEGDTIKTVTFENTPLRALVIYKCDAKTRVAIQGAEFQVQYLGNSGDTSVTKHTTTENGTITLTGLKAGTYIVQETKASPYYTLDDMPQTVVLTGNDQEAVTVEFANQPYGTVLIRKLSEKDNTPLAKATFLVTDDKGGFIGSSNGEFTTDAAGTIQIPKLPAGTTVMVKEIRAPEGYVLNSTPQTIRVEAGEVHSLTFYDESLSSLTVLKRDSETGKALAEAEFTVKYGDGTMIGRYTTGSDGTFSVTGLTPGSTIVVSEVKAPEGYVLKSTPQTITVRSGTANELVFENESQSQVIIRKVDSMTGKPLAGAQFKVVGAGDSLYMTDANGEVRITGLDPCTLTVTEVKAPNGHVLNTEPQVVTVKANETKTLTFANVPTTTLIIHKYIEGTDNEPLSGVAFKVTDISGAVVGPDDGVYYTDDAGEIVLTGLEPGMTVCAREIKTVNGYVLNGTPQDIVIKAGEAQHLTFWNERTVSLTIEKLDSVVKKPLGGAEFYVTDADGTPIGSTGIYVSNSDGLVTIPNLRPGQVLMVTERKAPAGYVRDTVAKTVSVKTGAENKLIFENTPQGQLIIRKVDSATGKHLAGAQFKVATSDGTFVGDAGGTITSNGLYTTDANGEIRITNLNPCTLVVTEVKAPAGYILDAQTQTVVVNANDTQTLTFTNTPKASLVIHKYIADTNNEPLSGVAFKVTDGSGKAIGTGDGIYYTDDTGRIELTGLEPGTTIKAQEIRTVDGYALNGTPQDILIEAGKEHSLTFWNEKLCNLTVAKRDSVTGKPLSGAEFIVKYGNGEIVGRYTTENDGTFTVMGLAPGSTVAVSETKAPSGYVLDTTTQTITVRSNTENTLTFDNDPSTTLIIHKYIEGTDSEPLAGVAFKVTDGSGGAVGPDNGVYYTDNAGEIVLTDLAPGTTVTVREIKTVDGYILDGTPQDILTKAGEVQELTFWNEKAATLTILKQDANTKKPLPGAEFYVTDGEGKAIGTSSGRFTTDANGLITITNLQPGITLRVSEQKAPVGYVRDDTPKTIVIKSGDGNSLVFENEPQGQLIIQKLDSVTKEPLVGAQFKVTTSNGAFVGNAGGTITSNGLYTTDENGQIHITGLDPCTLVVTEVNAPDGYILDAQPQTVVVNANDTQTLTFTNTPIGGLVIIKSDEDSGKRISGAKFEVRKMNGEVIGAYSTDHNGIIQLTELDSGWYTVTELKAASGYLTDSTLQQVEVKDGEMATLELTNRKASGVLLHKIDADTGEGIYGVTFLLYDRYCNPVGQYTTDQDGYIYVDEGLEDGRYYIREIDAADGYILDHEVKSIYIKYGSTTEIEWENTAICGQIQIIKKSANDNPINGLPAGTLLEDAVFEIYDKAGNKVDTIRTDRNGRAISKLLPLSRYTIREVQAPDYYAVNPTVMTAYLEYEGQIVTFEVEDESVSTGVNIKKTGYAEVIPGQPIKYTFTGIGNTSSVALSSFYWRDTLPGQVKLDKIVTGTYNQQLSYKVVYKTNLSEGYRTLADNLSTTRNYVLDASPTALGLAANERVTEVMFVFGAVKAGFGQVETPYIYGTVAAGLANGSGFVNTADAGGLYNGQWIMGVSRWVTKVYSKTIVTLPKTGY